MRNMSFMLTTQQMYAQAKDVTRRLGWAFLKAGDLVMACVKCQGLGKGGKIEHIHPIEIVSAEWEPLWHVIAYPFRGDSYRSEAEREGFPDKASAEFAAFFQSEMKCRLLTKVNRIEFKHRRDLWR